MPSNKVQVKDKEGHADNVERMGSFLYLLREWAENTSWGGVPYIVKKSNYLFKAVWMALVFAGLVITVIQVWQVFDRFYEYPVNININMTHTNKLTFPAVTVCNVNPMRLSGIPQTPLVATLTYLFENFTTTLRTGARRHRFTEFFQQIYNSMDYNTRLAISHRKEDMLLDCVYNGESCTTDDWVEWNDAVMGNCFTFNVGYKVNSTTSERYKVPVLETYRTGPYYGLEVELYIQEEEYIEGLTETAGVKVVVHNQDSAPFPADHGVLLQPATYSSISLQMTNISRQPYPFPSDCVTINDVEDAKKLDAYVETSGTTYKLPGCLKSCYQAYVIRECGCGDPKLPINTIATKYFTVNKTVIYRPCNTVAAVDCQHNVSKLFAVNLLSCDHCRLPCSSVLYTHSLSAARWPNDALMTTKLNQTASINSNFAKYMENASSPQNNILKFNLHFEELNYEVVYESPAYPSDSVYGDIGGVIGLWLGLSFIAVFEIIQLLIDVTVHSVTLLITRKQQSREKKRAIEDWQSN